MQKRPPTRTACPMGPCSHAAPRSRGKPSASEVKVRPPRRSRCQWQDAQGEKGGIAPHDAYRERCVQGLSVPGRLPQYWRHITGAPRARAARNSSESRPCGRGHVLSPPLAPRAQAPASICFRRDVKKTSQPGAGWMHALGRPATPRQPNPPAAVASRTASSTVTSHPWNCSTPAAVRPAMPAPMTTTRRFRRGSAAPGLLPGAAPAAVPAGGEGGEGVDMAQRGKVQRRCGVPVSERRHGGADAGAAAPAHGGQGVASGRGDQHGCACSCGGAGGGLPAGRHPGK
jgi:hypothetical protein